MDLLIFGASRSGKDTIARCLGWRNRKFSQWAKDWVDLTFGGGSFEETRYHYIAPGKTKLDLLIELYHLLKPYNASVHFAANNWDLPSKVPTCYTDVRTEAEMMLLAPYLSTVLVLPGGEPISTDEDLPKILEIAESYELEMLHWGYNHPASYTTHELKTLLGSYGLQCN